MAVKSGNIETRQLETIEMKIEEIHKKAQGIEIKGTTVNERLYISGLIHAFDESMKTDKVIASQILLALKVDDKSIDRIIEK